MLTDAALKALKSREKIYKIADRDGMYVRVMPSGAISFRLDYRLNGRRETVYLGKYGARRHLACPGPGEVSRREARYRRRTISGD
ncbi:Arm DNA-binding domain-containing protein [Mesorhizobium sp.]|uniref:Arm DNA-binding domain-containing protein n=1 Tax=Mesorhizobium sp. TaxID=1871066 RepID=UPI003437C6B9